MKALRWPLFGLSLLSMVPAAHAQTAQTLPSGGQVVAGQAVIGNAGGRTVISQSSDKAIVNWTDFSIGQGGEVDFDNGSGATLNRVTGGNLSSLDGVLKATGSVYLINPNGVIIGKNGVVSVGGDFVASALDVSNADFLSGGDLTFSGPSLASVVNLGRIGALGGDVALMAVDVRNGGEIDAANGTAGLIAGRNIIMRDSSVDDGRFLVVTGGSDTAATNDGMIAAAAAELRAEGGNIYALAGNTEGVIRATGVADKGGRIWLTAGEAGSAAVSGSALTAGDGGGNGGAITVAGGQVTVASDATLDASATGVAGHGGAISVIADKASGDLTFAGTALAKGGERGGQVETSGARVDFDGARVDTTAAGGRTGDWLIDPYDLTVDAAAAATLSTNLDSSNVTLQTTASGTAGPGVANAAGNGDITIASGVSWSGANTLTLDAYRSININAPITVAGSGAVVLTTNDGGAGDYGFGLQPDGFQGSLDFTGAGASLTINGAAYTLLYSLSDLAGISGTSGAYALARALDASGATYTAAPVDTFDGVLTGLGHTVDNLTVAVTGSGGAGLFNQLAGAVRDIGVKGGSISAYSGMAGGLVANSTGTLRNVYATDAVNARNFAGGLAGYSQGSITNAFATGNVVTPAASGYYVGGLVALDYGQIDNAFATGSVSGYAQIGGLVGWQEGGAIDNAYATGSAIGSFYTAGLVGYNDYGAISNAYATGYVNPGSPYSSNGAFVGEDVSGAYANVYYNSDTGGRSDAFATGLTTAQLQGALPSGLGAAAWATGPGLYPYLKSFFPNGAQAISGVAADASGAAAVGGSVAVYSGGKQLGTSGVGANGAYYLAVNAGAVGAATGVGASVTLSGDAGASGIGYADSQPLPDGNVTGLDVTSGRIAAATAAVSDSGLQTLMAGAFGGAVWSGLLSGVSHPDYDLTANGAFTVDDDLSGFGNLTIRSGGDLTVAHAITLNGDDSLTLDAHDNLNIDATVTAPGGNAVTLTYADGGAGDYGFGLQSGGFQGSLDFTGSGGGLTINGAAYTLLYSLSDLSTIFASTSNYALAQTLDASGTTYTGPVLASVWGVLTGLGHTVDNLTINSTGDDVGLVGYNYSVLRDIGVRGGSISGGSDVGGLVGQNYNSTLHNVYSTAAVSGAGSDVGGLVGYAWGSNINGVYAGGAVDGGANVGGLIGYNQSAGVQNAYATGPVGSSGDSVGGLIGYNNNATLTDAYATGSIRGNHNVGGLIGFSLGSAYYNVYAMGSVTGGAYVGGLLGTSFGGVYFEDAFATGFVRGQYTGGLVGVSESYTPTLIRSYYIPDTTGQCCTADGFGGGLAVTTAQLQGVLPSGFSSTDWGTGPGLYPYLKVFFPNGAQAISGMAYADTSGDAAVGSVAVYSGGKQLGTSGVGANGYYYVVTDAGAIGATTGVGADLTLYGDANPSGVGYADTHALTDGNVTGLDVTTGRIDVTTGAATDSSVQGGIASAFGSAVWSGVLANIGNPDYGLTATGAFTVDDDPPGFGNLTIRSGGDLTVAHAITLNGNDSLTLDAHDNLNIDATVTAPGNNAVTLTYADGGAGDYGFGLQSDGFQGSLDYTGSGGGLTINGAAYTLLYALSDLAGISGGSGAYALAQTLDASGATYSASVVGQLSGALTGLGHTVANLTISGAGVDNTGLIGQLKSGGVVRDIGLAGGAITGGTYVGGLVGVNNQGAVTDAYVLYV